MDVTGITWLDWVMAGFTVVGFALTGYGIKQAWKQAKDAKEAAEAAEDAVNSTRSQLIAVDLVHEFAAVRQGAAHVEAATETNNVEVAKFALTQLSEAMRRGVTLARDKSSPLVSTDVIEMLDETSKLLSAAKGEIAKRTDVKVRTYTGRLLPTLSELTHALLEFETRQKYVLPEEK